MIIVDVNILIYPVNRDAPLHARAKAWPETALSGTETIGIPWAVLLAFLRLTTRAGIFRRPMQLDAAFDVIHSWLEQPSVIIVEPGPRHRQILRGLLSEIGTGGNLTSNAHLVALAIEHRAELCSYDSDSLRFQGLKWRHPLA